MVEPPSQANGVQSQRLGFPCCLRTCAVLSLRRFRPPEAAKRHLWTSDPSNTMEIDNVANMVAKIRLQMASVSSRVNPDKGWQFCVVTHIFLRISCAACHEWHLNFRLSLSLSRSINFCDYPCQGSALKKVSSKTLGISAMYILSWCWSMPCGPILLKAWSTILTMGASGQIFAAIRPVFIADQWLVSEWPNQVDQSNVLEMHCLENMR